MFTYIPIHKQVKNGLIGYRLDRFYTKAHCPCIHYSLSYSFIIHHICCHMTRLTVLSCDHRYSADRTNLTDLISTFDQSMVLRTASSAPWMCKLMKSTTGCLERNVNHKMDLNHGANIAKFGTNDAVWFVI